MSSYNIEIQYPGIQGGALAGGVNTGVQYNNLGALESNANFTTDGVGNVSITGSGYSDGTLTIITQGADAAQQPALILRDNSGGDDGVSQYFQFRSESSVDPYDYQVSINYNGTIFNFIDDYASRTFFEYNSFISITLGDGNIPITLDSKIILQPVFVVSQLSPTGNTGARSFVNNSTVDATGNFGAIVVGGGAYTVPVWCDGTNWRIG